jgi:formylglycine-generating enzyme required for sulfatase activity
LSAPESASTLASVKPRATGQIEGATFMMGSDDSRDERPIHRVTIDGFLIERIGRTKGIGCP